MMNKFQRIFFYCSFVLLLGCPVGAPLDGYTALRTNSMTQMFEELMGSSSNGTPFSVIRSYAKDQAGQLRYDNSTGILTGLEGVVIQLGGKYTTTFIVEADDNLKTATVHLVPLNGSISYWNGAAWEDHQGYGEVDSSRTIDNAKSINGKVYVKIDLDGHEDPFFDFSNWGSDQEIDFKFYM